METLAMWMPGGWELVAIAVIGLLLFGRKLPEVGRNIGKSIVEFKRGIKDVEDEINREIDRPRSEAPKPLSSEYAKPPLDSSGHDPRVPLSNDPNNATGADSPAARPI